MQQSGDSSERRCILFYLFNAPAPPLEPAFEHNYAFSGWVHILTVRRLRLGQT